MRRFEVGQRDSLDEHGRAGHVDRGGAASDRRGVHATLEELREAGIVERGECLGDGAMSLAPLHRAAVEIITIVCSPDVGLLSQLGNLSLLVAG